jgi:cytochrome c
MLASLPAAGTFAIIGALALPADVGWGAIVSARGSESWAQTGVQGAQWTVWDGVYTEEQVKRGSEVYRDRCAACHLDSLNGDSQTQTPGLVGSASVPRWKNITVKDLYRTIETSMPQNEPGSLTAQAYVDVISFILKANGMPAGASELPTDTEKLAQIRFTAKPSKE